LHASPWEGEEKARAKRAFQERGPCGGRKGPRSA